MMILLPAGNIFLVVAMIVSTREELSACDLKIKRNSI